MKKHLTYENLSKALSGEPAFRIKQVMKAFCSGNCDSYHKITTLSLDLRERLEEELEWSTIKKHELFRSKEGPTCKALLSLHDDSRIETVLMPNNKDQYTLCVSSQIGCPVKCSFCATGKAGFKRNLDALEIIGQYVFWKRILEGGTLPARRISNIVFMGMGEPLLNYENVKLAIRLLLDHTDVGKGFITVSTVGLPGKLASILNDPDWPEVKIAISLHSADDSVRSCIVPGSEKNFVAELKAWCLNYNKTLGSRARPLTFETIMIKAVNDSEKDLKKLLSFLSGIDRAKVNLIPFNSHEKSPYKAPDQATLLAFQNQLERAGITTTIRKSLGQDIHAACGQLAGKGK